jgi:electron transfer flavoprotein alpha subunit
MTLATIWVVVEPSNGSLTSTSLELLTHARSLATNVAAITWGDDGASLAGVAGEYGATTLYNVGALNGALPGVPVAAAIAQLVAGAGAPDVILIPTTHAISPGASRLDSTGRY